MNDDNIKRLYRSKQDRYIAGICGGLGNFFKIDSTWIRLAFILLSLANGIGIVIYILTWMFVPENLNEENIKSNFVDKTIKNVKKKCKDKNKKHIYFGAGLIFLGCFFIIANVFPSIYKIFWPLTLVGVGVLILIKRNKR